MSDTRDEEKDRNKEQRSKVCCKLQDTQDPRNKCKIYNTGNILNSIIPVLYQSTVTVTCMLSEVGGSLLR